MIFKLICRFRSWKFNVNQFDPKKTPKTNVLSGWKDRNHLKGAHLSSTATTERKSKLGYFCSEAEAFDVMQSYRVGYNGCNELLKVTT